MKIIIEKWYKRLKFPREYDIEFYNALEGFVPSDPGTVEEYSTDENDFRANLMYHLYFCESLSEKYKERKIPEKILLDTLSDIVIWTKVCRDIHGVLGLRNSSWLKKHLSFKLFRLGRLQFCLGKFEKNYETIGVQAGEPMLEVHIPEGEPLRECEVERSFALANEFFEKYFQTYGYRFFTCHSWLLDKENTLIKEGSNIRKFLDRFTELSREESDAILRYTFRFDATRENLASFEPKSSLARSVYAAVLEGKVFYEVFGFIKK